MAINYPSSLDNFTNPTSASPVNSPSHADQHSNANDAIEALEAKVGANNSAVTTSHDYKIAQLESLVTSAVSGAKSIYQDVRNQSGSNFVKATPVYVSGSEGASGKMLISAASNASEATSSKTMGLTTSAISNNSNGQVISEGILEGIDTTGAVDGDPVWLGVNGAKIYGLLNKPSAPAHLVFLGIVIRGGQANTGSMYVKIQNGFELQEIHNVELSSLINGNILAYDSTTSTWKNTNTLQSSSSTVPLVVKGSGSQAADLQQWQNSSGASIVRFDAYGSMYGFNNAVYGNAYGDVLGRATYYTAPSTIGIVIRGAASQTANLQEWQDNTGAVKALVGSGGNAVFNGIRSGSGSTTAAINAYTTAAQIGILVRGAASQTANLQEWQDSTGAINASLTSTGDFRIANIYAISSFNNAQLNMLSTGARITTNVAANVTLTVKGALSQSANLTEWQDTTGSTKARVSASGAIVTSSVGVFGSQSAINNSQVTILNNNLSYPAITVKAAASQTANIQEWQDSAGTALNVIASSGTLVIGGTNPINSSFGITLVNKQIASYYSANNTNYITALNLTRGNTTGTWMNIGTVGDSANGISSVDIRNGGEQRLFSVGYNGNTIIDLKSTSVTGLIVKAFGTQTANLQEWQDSNGNVAAKVSSDYSISSIAGGFFGTLTSTPQSGTYLAVRPWAANHVPFLVKGFAAQTADLTRWVNDAGTTLAAVTSNGGIQAGTYNGVIISLNYPGIVIDTSNADNTQVWLRNLSATSKSGKFVGIKARPGYADAVSGDDLVTLEGQQYISSLGYASGKILISNDSSTPSATSYPARITFHTVAIDSTTLTERMRINNAGLVGINMTPTDAYLSVTGTSSKDAIRVYSQSGLAFWGAGTNNNIYSSGSMYLNGGDFAASARLIIGTGGVSNSGIVVRGVASQTAALQEWQDSSGTVLASITDTGFSTSILRVPYIYSYSIQGWNGVGGSIEFANATPITIKPQSASVVNLVIKGAVSQTADLQQWQDSAGTVLAGIGPNGRIYAQGKAGNTDDLLYLRRADNGVNFYVDKDATLRGNFSIRLNQEPTIDTQAYMWSGTGSRSALGVSGTGSTNPTFYAKATASQTSNLTEWQDSSGNAQAFVRHDGFINTNSSIRIAGDNLSVYRFQGVSDGNYTMNFPGSGNIQLFSATDSLGGGSKVLGISNATTVPSSNPTGGGILYVNSGSLVYRGAGGAITTIARSGNESSTISANTATTVDTVSLSLFTTIEYTLSIKQGSKVRSSKVLVHTDGTSVDSTEYGIIEMGGGITGIIVAASVSSTDSILQVTITDAATTNATVKLIKTML